MEENKTLISITVVSIPSKIQKTTMTRPKKILSTQTFTGYENCCPPFPFFFFPTLVVENNKVSRGGGGDFHLQRKVWSPPRFLRTHLEDGAKEEKVKFQRVIKKKKKGKVKVVEKLCCVPHKTWFERRESRVPPPPRDEFFRQKLSLSLFILNSRPTQKELSRSLYIHFYIYSRYSKIISITFPESSLILFVGFCSRRRHVRGGGPQRVTGRAKRRMRQYPARRRPTTDNAKGCLCMCS